MTLQRFLLGTSSGVIHTSGRVALRIHKRGDREKHSLIGTLTQFRDCAS